MSTSADDARAPAAVLIRAALFAAVGCAFGVIETGWAVILAEAGHGVVAFLFLVSPPLLWLAGNSALSWTPVWWGLCAFLAAIRDFRYVKPLLAAMLCSQYLWVAYGCIPGDWEYLSRIRSAGLTAVIAHLIVFYLLAQAALWAAVLARGPTPSAARGFTFSLGTLMVAVLAIAVGLALNIAFDTFRIGILGAQMYRELLPGG